MRRVSLLLIVMMGALVMAIFFGIFFYSEGINSNSSPRLAPTVTSPPTVMPTVTMTPMPIDTPIATPNPKLTLTYSEQSRNATMIVIKCKLEPNSYIFQLNAITFYLIEGDERISVNNNAVVVGTQYSTLFFPINGYNGTKYYLSNDALPSDTIWIKQ